MSELAFQRDLPSAFAPCGQAVIHCKAWASSLRVARSGADMDQISKYRQGKYFEVNQSLNEAFGSSIDFPNSLDELCPRWSPSVEVALGSNHSANVFRVLDHFHFAKLLTVCRHQVQQLMTTVAVMLNPTALPMIEIEPIHPGSHQRPEKRSRHRKIISIGTRIGLKKITSGGISRDDRVVEPSKEGRQSWQIGSHSQGNLA